MNEAEKDMKNSVGRGGCYPPRPKAEVVNILRDLQNSSYPTQPHSIIAKYIYKYIIMYIDIYYIYIYIYNKVFFYSILFHMDFDTALFRKPTKG